MITAMDINLASQKVVLSSILEVANVFNQERRCVFVVTCRVHSISACIYF